jgi:hypothetical protein
MTTNNHHISLGSGLVFGNLYLYGADASRVNELEQQNALLLTQMKELREELKAMRDK